MGRGILEDNRGQVSAELIVIIAALMAMALFFVGNLQQTVKNSSETMNAKTSEVLKKIEDW
ncbi:MAG: hypothetical protein KAW41_06605 [Candidatus Diapherotrites archaeon]|nr:hypothetical protein [Candidatus Diapherotrites archaeon]